VSHLLAQRLPPVSFSCGIKKQSSIYLYSLPRADAATKAKFQKHLAYYNYLTDTSFQRVEEENRREAVRLLWYEEGLVPDCRKLGDNLLDKYYSVTGYTLFTLLSCIYNYTSIV